MVEYVDGSVLAQLGSPDMRIPIAYALAWPERMETPAQRLDLAAIARLDFEAPDAARFPALRLAREALEAGGRRPIVLNAANEVAVADFLAGAIGFPDIAAMVEEALDERRFRQSAGRSTTCLRSTGRRARASIGDEGELPLMFPQPPLWLILVAFVCALGPLVFFHELGHYLVARLFEVPAEIFSIGFGRELFGWTDRQGTRWKVGWLPLGGYVKFVGDMNPASNPADLDEHTAESCATERSSCGRSGSASSSCWPGPPPISCSAIIDLRRLLRLAGTPRDNVVGDVVPKSAAAAAGIQPGDRIVVDCRARRLRRFDDVANVVMLRPGRDGCARNRARRCRAGSAGHARLSET